jgi:hypothetical protein
VSPIRDSAALTSRASGNPIDSKSILNRRILTVPTGKEHCCSFGKHRHAA